MKHKELAAIVEQEKILENLRTQLQNDTSNFTTVINQLAALSRFWTAVSFLTLPRVMIVLTSVQIPQTSAELTSLTIHLNAADSANTSMRVSPSRFHRNYVQRHNPLNRLSKRSWTKGWLVISI
jgi:hypothetical protein